MSATEPSMSTRATRASAAASAATKDAADGPKSPPPPSGSRSPTRRPPSPRKAAAASGLKKESFQWNTPADEFADDVGSEDEGEYMDGDDDVEEAYAEGSDADEEGIVIELGGDSQNFTVIRGGKKMRGETTDDIAKFLSDYGGKKASDGASRGEQVQSTTDSGKKKKPKQKFQCPKCDKIWNWPWELRRHVMTHYKEKERQQTSTFKCEDCGKGFQWKRDLAQHRRLHTGEKLLVCSVCNKKFTTRQALLHHVVVHTGEKPFQCALCGNRFTQPANLRTHMKKKHSDSNARTNKCPHCGETLPSIIQMHQHILEDHQDVVAGVREEQELQKLKKEKEKEDRARQREDNRRKREEKRKQNIDYNDFRAVKGMQEWEINYEFHIGEGLVRGVDWDRTPSNGELMCDICDRQFSWRYELMFHTLCHKTDEHGVTKNKVCPECSTAFKVPIGLKHHLLLHTGELPFLCLHCWRSFSSHIDLKLHIRKEHLFHLETPADKKPALATAAKAKEIKPKVKVEKAPKAAKRPSRGGAAAAAATATTSVVQLADGTTQQIVLGEAQTTAEGGMEVMLASQQGENGESQTVLVGSDGTIVQTGDQDMIVVIQSDDIDQSQGLIVVDPSQLQQMIGPDGTPITVLNTGGENLAVVSGGEQQQQQHHQAEAAETKMILAHGAGGAGGAGTLAPGTIITTSDGQQHTVVSTGADGAITVTANGAGEGESSHQLIVSDASATTAADGSIAISINGDEAADSKLGIMAAAAEKAAAMEAAAANNS